MITITKTDPDLKPIYFVSSALNLSSIRHHEKVLMVKDGKAHGTDGNRIHIAETSIADGHYEIVKRLKTVIILDKVDENDYPDITPILNRDYENPIDTSGLDYEDAKQTGFPYHLAYINRDGFVISPKKLQDIMTFCNFEIEYADQTSAIAFKSEYAEAYLMPYRKIKK